MKSRGIQDEPDRSNGGTSSDRPPGRARQAMNLPARAARWSGHHRKVAIFGWLAFVVGAFLLGNMIGANQLTGVDQFTGESHDAEQALDNAGLRPIEEVVLLKSDTLTLDDPEFQAAAED